jgi:hypothetical protein
MPKAAQRPDFKGRPKYFIEMVITASMARYETYTKMFLFNPVNSAPEH